MERAGEMMAMLEESKRGGGGKGVLLVVPEEERKWVGHFYKPCDHENGACRDSVGSMALEQRSTGKKKKSK